MTDVRRREGDGVGGLRDGTASFGELREAALTLRKEGLSRRQIRDRLKVGNNDLLNRLLEGEPPPEWTKRPNAKDDLRATARELRTRGLTYDQIQLELGCSKSSISLWVRDLPKPPPRTKEEASAIARRGWEATLARRDVERQEIKSDSAREIGTLSDQELLVAGVVLYWAEGTKDKAHARRELVQFINSDPDVIRLFLRWLALVGVEPDRLRCHVSIHESADIPSAERYWAELAGLPAEALGKTVIKKHNPKTVRKNVGESYRGCLVVRVRQGADLYRRIEGWWYGIVLAAKPTD